MSLKINKVSKKKKVRNTKNLHSSAEKMESVSSEVWPFLPLSAEGEDNLVDEDLVSYCVMLHRATLLKNSPVTNQAILEACSRVGVDESLAMPFHTRAVDCGFITERGNINRHVLAQYNFFKRDF